ncbi:MAG: hypothetical protein AAEJ04_09155, partial [Planctomycetota bacterium]
MNSFARRMPFLALLLFLNFPLFGQEWQERPYEMEISSSLDVMQEQHPAVRVERDRLGRTFLYGAPISHGRTDFEAVEKFLEDHAVLFGIFSSDLELIYESELESRSAMVFAYRQKIDGIPVEYSA